MKIQIVRDDKGNIIGSTEVAKGDDVVVKPVLEKGQTVEEVSAADQYSHDLSGFYKQHATPKKG